MSPWLRRRQPSLAAPSSQLGWGAKFTLKPRRRAGVAVCTLPCLPARGAQRPPCAVEARREGASPRNSAAGLSPRPLPALEADPSPSPSPSGAAPEPEPRWPPAPGGGTVSPHHRPPAPSARPPASYFRGPRPSALDEPRLPENSELPGGFVRACVCLSWRACRRVCAPGTLHAPGQRRSKALEIRLPGTLRGHKTGMWWRPADGVRAVTPSAGVRGGPRRRTEQRRRALGRCRVPAPPLHALAASRLDTWVLRQHKIQVCVHVCVRERKRERRDGGGGRREAGQKNQGEGRGKKEVLTRVYPHTDLAPLSHKYPLCPPTPHFFFFFWRDVSGSPVVSLCP